MKRLHVHIAVADLERSIRFYSTLFGAKPGIQKSDYAKWMLEDPQVNFAISDRNTTHGLDHLGIQVETEEELEALRRQLTESNEAYADRGATTCCYHESVKGWTTDPSGISWEAFMTTGEADEYGTELVLDAASANSCCPARPESSAAACC